MRRRQAAGLLAGWVASVAAVAMVTWVVLGIALGQILPTAVPSSQPTALSIPHSAPSDQDSSDPDSPARSGRSAGGSRRVGGSGSGPPGSGEDPVAGRGMTRFGPVSGADASDRESSWAAPGTGLTGGAPMLQPPTGTTRPSAPAAGPGRVIGGAGPGRVIGGAGPGRVIGGAGPSGGRPTGSPSDPVSGTPFGPAPMAGSGPSGTRAGGGDLTPEQVPRELRTGSLLGRQGQVLIACSAARLVDWSVLPAAGWAAAVTGKGPTEIQVEFTEPGTVLAVIAECAAGFPRFWRSRAGSDPSTTAPGVPVTPASASVPGERSGGGAGDGGTGQSSAAYR